MTPVMWDSCRRKDWSIDLRVAARMTGCRFTELALNYLDAVEKIMPIKSRQTAAVAIASALEISARDDGDSQP